MAGVQRKSLEPWLKDDIEFRKHQAEGVRRMQRMKSVLLADDMGLGKSLQALTVVAIDIKRGYTEKVIVVCPSTLKKNWRFEIEKFTRLPYVVIPGTGSTGATRARLIDEFDQMQGPRVLIINYEQVVAYRSRLNRMGFDIAIFDEAHYIKNPSAARSREARKLWSRRSILLTGSPMPNHVGELWPLLDRINPGDWGTYRRFLAEFAVYGGYKDKAIVGTKNKERLRKRLAAVMIRRKKEDVLDLPPVQYVQRYVGMLPKQMKIYGRAYEDMLLDVGDGYEPEAIANAAVKFLRLLQICGTTLTISDEDLSEKLDLAVTDAVELIQGGHHIVIFTRWRKVQEAFVQRLQKALPDAPVRQLHGGVPADDILSARNGEILHPGRETIKGHWEADEPGALVCMFQVAGVGLNMTKAKHMLMLDKLFVPDLNQQAVDRIHRIGSEIHDQVIVFEYIVADSVEQRVHEILEMKKRTSDEVVEMKAVERNMMLAVLEAERKRDNA